MRLTIAYSKMKKLNLVLINNVTHQREALPVWPIRLPLNASKFDYKIELKSGCNIQTNLSVIELQEGYDNY